MVRWTFRSVALGGIPAALVGVASVAGVSLAPTECSELAGLASVVAAVFALLAVCRPATSQAAVGRVAGIILLVWLVAATVTEPFAWIHGTHGVLLGVAWLVPMVVGAVALPGRGELLAGAGSRAALFAGAMAMAYSVSHTHSGVGRIVVWRD